MKVRVIDYSDYEEWYEEQLREGKDVPIEELTDEQFMHIYQLSHTDWEFKSLQEFTEEFNTDGPSAPMPSEHIIRFFPNE